MEKSNAPAEAPWYCVQVKPKREPIAFKFLHDQGYRPFCPYVHQDELRARRVPLSKRPFLPGYLFIQVSEALGFHGAKNTRGVLRILSYSPTGTPTVVPQALIDDLVSRVTAGGGLIRLPAKPLPSFEKGEGVPVVGGPLSGHVGVFEQLYVEDDQVRITLWLDVMGHRKSISFPLAHIAPE